MKLTATINSQPATYNVEKTQFETEGHIYTYGLSARRLIENCYPAPEKEIIISEEEAIALASLVAYSDAAFLRRRKSSAVADVILLREHRFECNKARLSGMPESEEKVARTADFKSLISSDIFLNMVRPFPSLASL